AGGGEQVFTRGHVMEERGPGDEERAAGEEGGVEGRDRSRRLPEERDHAQRLQAVERAEQGVLADRVVDDAHALAAGDVANPVDEPLPRIDTHVLAAVRAGQL